MTEISLVEHVNSVVPLLLVIVGTGTALTISIELSETTNGSPFPQEYDVSVALYLYVPIAVGVNEMFSPDVAVSPEPVKGVADHCTEYPAPALLMETCKDALSPRQISSSVDDMEISGVFPIMTLSDADAEQLLPSVTTTEY